MLYRTIVLIVTLALALSACAGGAGQTTPTSAAPASVAPVSAAPVSGTESVLPAAAGPYPAAVTEAPASSAPPADPTTGASAYPAATAYPAANSSATPASAAIGAEGVPTGVVVYALAPEESTITYDVGETFINQGNVFNRALGKTTGVTGEVRVDFDQPMNTHIGALAADITGFASDSSRRDGAIRDRFLESARYPSVTFTPTAIRGLPAAFEAGVDYPVTISGDLTIRETTQPAEFQATVRLEDDAIHGQASTSFLMSAFGFGPISIMGMLKTEDEVKITVDFVARPQ